MLKQKVIIRIGFVVAALSTIFLFFIFYLVDPNKIMPFHLLLVFGLIYIIVFSWLTLIWLLLRNITRFLISRNQRRNSGVGYKSLIYIALVSFVPIYIVAIQSIRKVAFYEIILVVILVSLAVFYIKKR